MHIIIKIPETPKKRYAPILISDWDCPLKKNNITYLKRFKIIPANPCPVPTAIMLLTGKKEANPKIEEEAKAFAIPIKTIIPQEIL